VIGTFVPRVLTLSLLFQTILSFAQVFLGHSVGGLLYYLGERSVAVGSPGIALATFMDHVVLRAYGTFGHPNILAGYAIISLLIILRLSPQFRSLPACAGRRASRRVIGTFAIALTTLLVLLTQSRSAAISLFGLIVPFYLIKNLKSRIIYLCILALAYFCIPSMLAPTRSDLSSSQRLTLQGLSLSVVRTYPIFGTGAQASISTYPLVDPSVRLLQPDHNSFTLFFSWFGLFGILAMLPHFRSLRASRRVIGTFAILVPPLFPLLLLDHYLLTSPQGLFIFILYLAIAVNYSHAQKNL